MNSILLVEDDTILSFSIAYTLTEEGFHISTAGDLETARKLLEQEWDLILLDVKLPDGSGYELCREVRKASQVPIIFLTACDEEVNIVSGLNMGADDYITKPFRIKELISRIHAVLRRSAHVTESTEILVSGELQAYPLEGKVRKNGRDIQLTAMEYKLLLNFIKHPRQVLGRSNLLEDLWDINGEFIDDSSLSVYIRRLREKVEDSPADPKYIVTVRGLGYKWDSETRNG